jgi:hypothetical protein
VAPFDESRRDFHRDVLTVSGRRPTIADETSSMSNSVLPRTHNATGALFPRSFIRVGQCGCSGVTSSAPNRAADRNAISTAPDENFGITRSRRAL